MQSPGDQQGMILPGESTPFHGFRGKAAHLKHLLYLKPLSQGGRMSFSLLLDPELGCPAQMFGHSPPRAHEISTSGLASCALRDHVTKRGSTSDSESMPSKNGSPSPGGSPKSSLRCTTAPISASGDDLQCWMHTRQGIGRVGLEIDLAFRKLCFLMSWRASKFSCSSACFAARLASKACRSPAEPPFSLQHRA